MDHMPGCPPAKTEVKVLGFVNGVAFVRIVYEVKSDPFVDGSYREPQFLTSILAKTGPDEYHEILHQQNWPFVSYFGHAKFFTIDGTSFIYSQLDGGGNAHGFTEIILRVTADGVRMMDPKPIHDAAQRVIPTDSFGYSPASAFSFKELTWRIATEAKTNPIPKMGCCDGTAEVKFKIKDGTFIPSGAKFFPGRFESQRYWREVD